MVIWCEDYVDHPQSRVRYDFRNMSQHLRVTDIFRFDSLDLSPVERLGGRSLVPICQYRDVHRLFRSRT